MNERRYSEAEFSQRLARYGVFYRATLLTQMTDVQRDMLARLDSIAQETSETHVLIERNALRDCVAQYAIDLQAMFTNSFGLLVQRVFEGEE